MGIQLDWQIESDRAKQRATEDPNAKRYRRRQRRNLLLGMTILACLVGSVLGGVIWRLRAVDNQVRQNLLDTVDVEITAINVGNLSNYMQVKRSASEDWLQNQRDIFNEYQQLKQAGQLELTGKVLDVTIDEPRGRVVLEEKVAGVPYRVVWFYWLYEDNVNGQAGWRRVPPDVEFWGSQKTIDKGSLKVVYHELDRRMAEAMANQVDGWWDEACSLLICSAGQAQLTIEIVPETLAGPEWDLYEEWKVRVPSPLLLDRGRNDVPFTPELEAALAHVLAEKLADYSRGNSFRPNDYSDAQWLQEEIVAWLAGQFTSNTDDGSRFFTTFDAAFGSTAPSQILSNLRPDSTLSDLQLVTGNVAVQDLGLERLNTINWNDFFQWRLKLEGVTLRDQNQPACYQLYDETIANGATAANTRCAAYDPNQIVPIVNGTVITNDTDGNLFAYVDALANPSDTSQREQIIFRWVGSTWKRIN
ncbi:MAG: hypothetical protein HY862_10075 [Chloroflexi bacterium]|nr:hypothetical protein [Chloroflexota bacterium]